VLLRRPLGASSDDLVCHELCHVWQMQHRPLAMPLSYLYRGYASNPYELEARAASSPGGSEAATSSPSGSEAGGELA
jgi:hypothetical protein